MFTINCPTCAKRIEYERMEDALYRPFCCKRCQSIDLGHWLNEDYRVSDPGPDASENDTLEP